MDKFYVPNPGAPPDTPVRLRKVVILGYGSELRVTRLNGLEALGVLAENTYRPGLFRLLGREAEHFRMATWLLGEIEVLRLERPWDLDALPETIALLQKLGT